MLECINSFSPEVHLNDVAMGYQCVKDFCKLVSTETLLEMAPTLNDLNGWYEHDNIILCNTIYPMIKLLQQGYSEQEVLSLDVEQLSLAVSAQISYDDFIKRYEEQDVASCLDPREAVALLQGRHTRDSLEASKYVANWEDYKPYIPSWVKEKKCLGKFLAQVKAQHLTQFYLEAISTIDADSFFQFDTCDIPILVRLCVQPLLKRSAIAHMSYCLNDGRLVWLHIIGKNRDYVYPLSQWRYARDCITQLEGEYRLTYYENTVILASVDVGWVPTSIPVSQLPPCADSVHVWINAMLNKLNYVETDERVLYQDILPILINIVLGYSDWCLHLKFPKLFAISEHMRVGVSMAYALLRISNVKFECVATYSQGALWYDNSKTYCVYVEYLRDAFASIKKEATKIYVGKEKIPNSAVIRFADLLCSQLR